MTSCLVLQALIYRAFKESILQGCFWAACFSMAPWTAPVRGFEHNSVYTVLSVQLFNGAFIRCWIIGLHVLSESWCVKLWHRVLCLVLSASQNLVLLTVLLLSTKADRAALSLAHLTAAEWSHHVWQACLGWDTGVQKQPFGPGDLAGKQLETWLSSVHCGTGNIIAQLKDFFSVSNSAYTFAMWL